VSDEWGEPADRDFAATAVVTGVLEDDDALVALALEPLTRAQLVEIVAVIASWFVWALTEAKLDPHDHMQHVAMDLARRVTGLDPDE